MGLRPFVRAPWGVFVATLWTVLADFRSKLPNISTSQTLGLWLRFGAEGSRAGICTCIYTYTRTHTVVDVDFDYRPLYVLCYFVVYCIVCLCVCMRVCLYVRM